MEPDFDPAVFAGLLADDIDPVTAYVASQPEGEPQQQPTSSPGLAFGMLLGVLIVLAYVVAKFI